MNHCDVEVEIEIVQTQIRQFATAHPRIEQQADHRSVTSTLEGLRIARPLSSGIERAPAKVEEHAQPQEAPRLERRDLPPLTAIRLGPPARAIGARWGGPGVGSPNVESVRVIATDASNG